MPDAKPTAVTTTGRTAAERVTQDHDAPNPGPHNPDAHGPEHGATADTTAQKLENEAAAGEENRY